MKSTLRLALLLAGTALRLHLPAQAAPASPQGHRLAPATPAAAPKAGRAVAFQPLTYHVLGGYVFEDVNYGGGTGHAAGASGTVGRPGVRVEIYSSSGGFLGAATTDANGYYSVSALPNTYIVRVVNNTVTSSRPGYSSSLVPVQTYNNYNNNTNVVGGIAPEKVDAGANSTSLGSLNTSTTIAQSQAVVNFPASDITNVNFGFNFDVVVNTNDAGQGSLRQFILNSNALGGEGDLTQSGSYTDARNLSAGNPAASQASVALPAGYESSIFMIPASALPDGKVAVIAPATALPQLTGANTIVNGATQTYNIGNTNDALLGSGGTVGTQATPLSKLSGPEVQLVGSTAIGIGLNLAGAGSQVRGLAIYGFGNFFDNNSNSNITIAASNVVVADNVLGSAATSFAVPPVANNNSNVRVASGTGVSFTNNLIGFANGTGIYLAPAVAGTTITGNEIRGHARTGSIYDGIDSHGSATTATGNLFADGAAQGFDSDSSPGGHKVTGNTFTNNGIGNGTDLTESAAARFYGTGNVFSQNISTGNYGAGVEVAGGTTVISRNSIYNNGTSTSAKGAAATGQLGIDLIATGQNDNLGTSPFVTRNSAATAGANGLLNYPVLRTARLTGSSLVLTGYAKPGAVIELFLAQANPTSPNATGASFGQGKAYLFTLTEGTNDTDASTGLSYSGLINGFDQGTDSNASGFTFTIALTSAQQALVQAGALLTSTATLGGATSEFSGIVRVANAPAPLPVVLTAFTTQAVANRNALLSWATASEVNNDHFEVERSFDGAAFTKIGTVAGRGTTAVASAYAFTDAGVAARATGPVYYRLRQVDLGGAGTYSPVRAVRFGQATTVALAPYPNPAADRTTVDLSALDAATTVRAQLLDATGRVVRSWALAGGQPQELPLRDLASGTYLLVVAGTQPDGSLLRQALRLSRL